MKPDQKQLIYIHGFQSSAKSLKATETATYLRQYRPDIEFIVPELPDYPQPAIEKLEQIIAGCDGEVGLVGSSLGGFYATYLSQKLGIKAVLINPAVTPHILIKGYLGRNQNPYTGNVFTLSREHIACFETMLIEPLPSPDNLLVMVQTMDETLDYRLAAEKYCDCQLVVEAGGNHRFEGYSDKMAQIIRFLKL